MVCEWSVNRVANTLTASLMMLLKAMDTGSVVSPYEPGLMLWRRLGSSKGLKNSSALSSTIPGPSGFGSDEIERNKVA